MSEWRMKRFWTEAAPVETGGGWGIALDGRPVRTPAKALLELPTRALAEAAAAEWNAQKEVVDPGAMPVTRTGNSAIDKVAPQFAEVARLTADYGGTDLVCYRAGEPPGLVQRQTAAWDPLLDWAAETLRARLLPVAGVMFQPQDARALERLHEQVRALDPWRLTAFSDLVALSGSLVLGFAVVHGARDADEAWSLSRIDEDWQVEQWGEDEEAAEMAEVKRAAFLDAAGFIRLAGA
jgi:chaperone required for assembly of F1-ATPase